MICANPDLVVERGNKLLPCAGALAERYAALGQPVIQAGKPYRPIYEAALQVLGDPIDLSGILAIGDGIETDMKGAATLGIDAVYIVSRVHVRQADHRGGIDPELLRRLFAGRTFRPVGIMDGLAR
jgi:ribonucleotide monophosphatase NagD (HAD superfamily)